MAQEDRIARLARQIEAAQKAERPLADPEQLALLRRQGAGELHGICAEFVTSLNSRLGRQAVELAPAEYSPENLRETGANLIQILAEGRLIQIAFEAPAQPVSTEKFLVPYVLEGELRAYNQELLQRFEVRSRLLFYCVEQGRAGWRWFDWRTRKTGPVNGPMLAELMEALF